jgi:hypothetical protein
MKYEPVSQPDTTHLHHGIPGGLARGVHGEWIGTGSQQFDRDTVVAEVDSLHQWQGTIDGACVRSATTIQRREHVGRSALAYRDHQGVGRHRRLRRSAAHQEQQREDWRDSHQGNIT